MIQDFLTSKKKIMKSDEEIWKDQLNLIYELKKIDGAISYDGECSVQVKIPTKDGNYLRVGITDPDVSNESGIWWDYYPGLQLKSNND